jgi:2-polyprenyl-3-methyl-5-hydroxy-6-metoxy-1,4-benzoquinol methylase
MLSAGGLAIKVKKGFSVNPVTRHYSLTDSDKINYMIMGKKHSQRRATI